MFFLTLIDFEGRGKSGTTGLCELLLECMDVMGWTRASIGMNTDLSLANFV